MKLYRVDNTHAATYHGTLADAHKAAKTWGNPIDVLIEEVEVTTGKGSILELLNKDPSVCMCVTATGKKWELTPRGGLALVP